MNTCTEERPELLLDGGGSVNYQRAHTAGSHSA